MIEPAGYALPAPGRRGVEGGGGEGLLVAPLVAFVAEKQDSPDRLARHPSASRRVSSSFFFYPSIGAPFLSLLSLSVLLSPFSRHLARSFLSFDLVVSLECLPDERIRFRSVIYRVTFDRRRWA